MTTRTATLDTGTMTCPKCGRTMTGEPEEIDTAVVHYGCACECRVGVRLNIDGTPMVAWRE